MSSITGPVPFYKHRSVLCFENIKLVSINVQTDAQFQLLLALKKYFIPIVLGHCKTLEATIPLQEAAQYVKSSL